MAYILRHVRSRLLIACIAPALLALYGCSDRDSDTASDIRRRVSHDSIPAGAPAAGTPAVEQAGLLVLAPGRPADTVRGTIRGYETADYRISAPDGSEIAVDLSTTSRFLYFVARSGDSTIGMETTTWQGAASDSLAIRLFLVRAEARRNGTADYSVTARLQ